MRFFALLFAALAGLTEGLRRVTLASRSTHIKLRPNRWAWAIDASLREYLEECKGLGPVRFVVSGNGAILETIGSFENLRFSELPSGKLATVSTETPRFECHIRCNKVEAAHQVVVEKNGKKLKIIRFNGRDPEGSQTTFLSAIVHREEGSDNGDGCFEKLQERYGNIVSFTDCVF